MVSWLLRPKRVQHREPDYHDCLRLGRCSQRIPLPGLNLSAQRRPKLAPIRPATKNGGSLHPQTWRDGFTSTASIGLQTCSERSADAVISDGSGSLLAMFYKNMAKRSQANIRANLVSRPNTLTSCGSSLQLRTRDDLIARLESRPNRASCLPSRLTTSTQTSLSQSWERYLFASPKDSLLPASFTSRQNTAEGPPPCSTCRRSPRCGARRRPQHWARLPGRSPGRVWPCKV